MELLWCPLWIRLYNQFRNSDAVHSDSCRVQDLLHFLLPSPSASQALRPSPSPSPLVWAWPSQARAFRPSQVRISLSVAGQCHVSSGWNLLASKRCKNSTPSNKCYFYRLAVKGLSLLHASDWMDNPAQYRGLLS